MRALVGCNCPRRAYFQAPDFKMVEKILVGNGLLEIRTGSLLMGRAVTDRHGSPSG